MVKVVVLENDDKECEFNYLTEKTLKQLSDYKGKAKERVDKFVDDAVSLVKRMESERLVSLKIIFKEAEKAMSNVIKKAKKAKKLKDDIKEKALDALENYFVLYDVKDNSSLVIDAVMKCIGINAKCDSLANFLNAIPQEEVFDIAKEVKASILAFCKKGVVLY